MSKKILVLVLSIAGFSLSGSIYATNVTTKASNDVTQSWFLQTGYKNSMTIKNSALISPEKIIVTVDNKTINRSGVHSYACSTIAQWNGCSSSVIARGDTQIFYVNPGQSLVLSVDTSCSINPAVTSGSMTLG